MKKRLEDKRKSEKLMLELEILRLRVAKQHQRKKSKKMLLRPLERVPRKPRSRSRMKRLRRSLVMIRVKMEWTRKSQRSPSRTRTF